MRLQRIAHAYYARTRLAGKVANVADCRTRQLVAIAAMKRPLDDDGGADAPIDPDDAASLTPLQRELLHTQQERKGVLTFPIITNDDSPAAVTALIQLKAIFCQQLPKMPKEYISRLVLDRQHVSLACAMRGEIVGGITYRPVKSQALSEIVFCAVSAHHQVQGYGTRIMNQIKEECKRTGIEGMLTYADNHAVGYFRKRGHASPPRAPRCVRLRRSW
jgi:histone acetyltransferase